MGVDAAAFFSAGKRLVKEAGVGDISGLAAELAYRTLLAPPGRGCWRASWAASSCGGQ